MIFFNHRTYTIHLVNFSPLIIYQRNITFIWAYNISNFNIIKVSYHDNNPMKIRSRHVSLLNLVNCCAVIIENLKFPNSFQFRDKISAFCNITQLTSTLIHANDRQMLFSISHSVKFSTKYVIYMEKIVLVNEDSIFYWKIRATEIF